MQGVDYARLEEHLRALAYASRLQMINQLRVPCALADLRVQPQQTKEGQNPARPMARQTLQEHLDRLVDAGIVHQGRGRRDGSARTVNEYVVNQQRLFAILEELRRVFSVPAQVPEVEDATAPALARLPAPRAQGPQLVLVHGLHEGRVFPLRDGEADDRRGWVIGRRNGLPVALTYDPFVSSEHAEIRRGGGGFELRSLASARNGTFHNWREVPAGEPTPLRSGDVVGVGRSLLVLREG